MSLLPPIPFPVASVPVSPNIFMLALVGSACVYAAIIVFNVLSLKHKSTHRLSVASVITLLGGLLLAEASVGLLFNRDSEDVLSSVPGKVALGVLVVASVLALIALVHGFVHQHRFRRGRKRAFGSFFGSLLAIGVLLGISHSDKSPHVPTAPKTKVALLPETDAYGRPLPATPAPTTPPPATPPPATPLPIATPAPIATPTPRRLLPNVITTE